MAEEKHLEMLREGVEVWNKWREQNPDIEPNLESANFTGAILTDAQLYHVNLTDANLENANLTRAVLDKAILKNANLTGAVLDKANLENANLTGAILTGAILTRAILDSAILTEAKVYRVNLTRAILERANLTGANLKSALTFPVKCFWQAASLHKGRVILTSHARELGCQWESYDDVRDNHLDKQQPALPKQRLKWEEVFGWLWLLRLQFELN